MSDHELLKLIRTSPEKGYRALYDEYFNYVYAIILRTFRGSGSHEDIEECLVDTFADVLRQIDHIKDSVKSYIGTAARNHAINASRKLNAYEARHVPLESVGELPSEQDLAETVEKKEYRQFLLQKIQSLGEPDATIIIRKYYYQQKISDIASLTGLSSGAVKVRCSRALKRLKKELIEGGMLDEANE